MNVYNHRGMRVPGMIQDGGALPRMKMGGTIKALKALSQKSKLASKDFFGYSHVKPIHNKAKRALTKASNKSSKLHKKLRGQQVDYFSKHGKWPKGVEKTRFRSTPPISQSSDYIRKAETNLIKKLGNQFDDVAVGAMGSTTGYAKKLQKEVKRVKKQAKHNRKIRTKRKKK